MIALIVAAGLSALGWGAGREADAQTPVTTPGLFTSTTRAPASSRPASATVLRTRYVEIDFARLGGTTRAGAATSAARVTLNLFADVTLTAMRERVEPSTIANGYSWIGRVEGMADLSSVTLVVKDGVLTGLVIVPDGSHEIHSTGNSVHAIDEINRGAFPKDLHPVPPPEPRTPDAQDEPEAMSDYGSLIDILVLYTATTRAAAGGTSQIQGQIQAAVTATNTAYGDSGITQRLRLVAVQEVAYTETGNQSTDLNRLTATNDGIMDSVHSLRNTHGADLVSLIVESGGQA